MEEIFSRFAQWTGAQLGKPHTFALAGLCIVIWAILGPVFGYSDTWQLVINTGTTIITFLMVFLLQHGQNRDTRVIQLKLDELIRANDKARNALLGLEGLTEAQMRRIQERFAELAKSGVEPDEIEDAQEDLEKAQAHVVRLQEKIAQGV